MLRIFQLDTTQHHKTGCQQTGCDHDPGRKMFRAAAQRVYNSGQLEGRYQDIDIQIERSHNISLHLQHDVTLEKAKNFYQSNQQSPQRHHPFQPRSLFKWRHKNMDLFNSSQAPQVQQNQPKRSKKAEKTTDPTWAWPHKARIAFIGLACCLQPQWQTVSFCARLCHCNCNWQGV